MSTEGQEWLSRVLFSALATHSNALRHFEKKKKPYAQPTLTMKPDPCLVFTSSLGKGDWDPV